MTEGTDKKTSNFIRNIVDQDLSAGKTQQVHTRFPPEPNGYLHVGHAKSICLNFGLANDYRGICNLRFDDTNPSKEEQEYVDAIQADVKWLGFDWDDRLFFASDYFEQLYQYAEHLIVNGNAYVCHLDGEQMRSYRGTLTEPGKNSPYRDRTPDENLDLFRRMRAGEFEEGACVLRAKIDMSSPIIQMRDPAIYRIKKVHHHRTGDDWCIYPMYDFTHCISDALEGITHSICTLEFENHRPLYDWILDKLPVPCHPQQIEFARLNLTHTLMSKRKLLALVEEGHVAGWDDPRMPTIAGMRRRGYTPESLREFCERIGVAKADSTVDLPLLEFCVREDLNAHSPRVMAVLDPIKLVITNYPEDQVEELDAAYFQDNKAWGSRSVPFSRELWIERDDFREDNPKKWFRLAPGQEVRLKFAYYVTCQDFVKNEAGDVVEIHATYDPATRGGWSNDGRKVKGTLHWVSAAQALAAEVRLYDTLFLDPNPGSVKDVPLSEMINPDSLRVVQAWVEPSLAEVEAGHRVQFERTGYFCVDPDSKRGRPVFNRTVTLKDSWAKIEAKLNA
ncbi:MAG: glutamine--tRNA ligase/YqeY domain fusion protein [Acidobacteria bacterium]|nr:glutamine--tRNA ligase/YqeY domain fusion protein [Acidobacteriota bacterium]